MSKQIVEAIQAKNYLATDQQLAMLARFNSETDDRLSAGRSTYLRVLAAGVQIASGMDEPRTKPVRGRLPSMDAEEQIARLNETHEHYYSVILQAITTEDIEDKPGLKQAERSRRALERNRRSTFARTSKASLLAYVRAGGDVRALVVPQVTKGSLRAYVQSKEQPKTQPSVEESAQRVLRAFERVRELLGKDNEALADIAQQVILQLSDAARCEKYTKSPRKAIEENRPLHIEGHTFLPLPAANESGMDRSVTFQ